MSEAVAHVARGMWAARRAVAARQTKAKERCIPVFGGIEGLKDTMIEYQHLFKPHKSRRRGRWLDLRHVSIPVMVNVNVTGADGSSHYQVICHSAHRFVRYLLYLTR